MYRSFSPEVRCAADSISAKARVLNTIFSGTFTTDTMLAKVGALTRELELAACALREMAEGV
jgi:hypothetical protein